MSSMEIIFGKFYTNKNLAIEFSRYLVPEDLVKLAMANKKFHQVYSQDLIWWVYLYSSFPELR